MYDRITSAAAAIRQRIREPLDIALILGTGLGELPAAVSVQTTIPYDEIEAFPHSTAPGHAGRLVVGDWHGRRIAVMQGRFHLYEGWTPRDVAVPVYTLKALGAGSIIVTNAAGALNENYATGDVMLIEDQMNFTGATPLTGIDDERLGARFPDMSAAYSRSLARTALAAAAELDLVLRRGVYAGVAGPALESSAERRFFRQAGADAIGMSTVIEVIAANHCGLEVLGLSAITNKATGGPDQQPDTIAEVLRHAATAGRRILRLLDRVVPALDCGS